MRKNRTLEGLGLGEGALPVFVPLHGMLGLRTFLTTGEKKRRGPGPLNVGRHRSITGRIHTDFERGLSSRSDRTWGLALGSWTAARQVNYVSKEKTMDERWRRCRIPLQCVMVLVITAVATMAEHRNSHL